MAKINLWNNNKIGHTYKTVDFHAKQHLETGSAVTYIHKYIAPETVADDMETKPKNDITFSSEINSSEITVQDIFYLENRDRKYESDIIELKGNYQINDADFSLSQFGLFLNSDSLYITYHYSSMVNDIGRKLMAGDVIELPSHREYDLLDPDKPAINKYYTVEEGIYPAEGYSPTWSRHLWRVKCTPVQNSQEFSSILDKNLVDSDGEDTGKTIADVMSTQNTDMDISNKLDEEGTAQVPYRNYDERFLYITPVYDENGEMISFNNHEYPIMMNSHNEPRPPNGIPVTAANGKFPENAQEGDWCLRVDYQPNVLFRRYQRVWKREAIDLKTLWRPSNDTLTKFINNEEKIEYQETKKEIPSRQMTSKVFKAFDDD